MFFSTVNFTTPLEISVAPFKPNVVAARSLFDA